MHWAKTPWVTVLGEACIQIWLDRDYHPRYLRQKVCELRRSGSLPVGAMYFSLILGVVAACVLSLLGAAFLFLGLGAVWLIDLALFVCVWSIAILLVAWVSSSLLRIDETTIWHDLAAGVLAAGVFIIVMTSY